LQVLATQRLRAPSRTTLRETEAGAHPHEWGASERRKKGPSGDLTPKTRKDRQ